MWTLSWLPRQTLPGSLSLLSQDRQVQVPLRRVPGLLFLESEALPLLRLALDRGRTVSSQASLIRGILLAYGGSPFFL